MTVATAVGIILFMIIERRPLPQLLDPRPYGSPPAAAPYGVEPLSVAAEPPTARAWVRTFYLGSQVAQKKQATIP